MLENVNVEAGLVLSLELPAEHLVVPHLLLIVTGKRTVHHASAHWVVTVLVGSHHAHRRGHHRRH
jgi:hypothetical protein